MPKMLGEGSTVSVSEEMQHIIERMTVRSLKRDMARLLKLIEAK